MHQIVINSLHDYFQKPHTQWHVADVTVEPWSNDVAILNITDRQLAVGPTHQHEIMVLGRGFSLDRKYVEYTLFLIY